MDLKEDVVAYYSKVAPEIAGFLGEREVASRVWLSETMRLIKRGSKEEPLKAEELSQVDDNFFSLREGSLGDARGKITKTQERIWTYFPPRKLCDLFYATNFEKGNEISRVFFDLDRKGDVTAEDAFEATKVFCDSIEESSDFKPHVLWTGNSFHVYLFFKAKKKSFYEKFQAGKGFEGTLTEDWIGQASEKTKVEIRGGHERVKDAVVVDPSQTPPGKLARAPFSLHMAGPRTIDGVCLPIGELGEVDVKKLVSYTPEMVLENIDELAKLVPSP